jgi:hypothetical protein
MAGTNDFQVFAGAAGANCLQAQTGWPSTYLGLAARSTGFQSGIAQSIQLNTVWRQSSIIASMIAQFICDNSGANSVDDGTIATLEANFRLAIQSVTRTKVTAPVQNFYVNTVSGLDSNSGLSNTTPKKTIASAIVSAYSLFDYAGNSLTINVAPGTYNESVSLPGLPLGCIAVNLIGNNSNPSSVVISVTNANAINISNFFVGAVQGLTVQATGSSPNGFGIVPSNAFVTCQNIIFNSCGNVQLGGGFLSTIIATGPLTFQGTSTYGVGAESASQIVLNSITCTFAGGTQYTQAWGLGTQGAFVNLVGTVFTGSFTGQRYQGNLCGGFSTGGTNPATFIPGTVAGALSTNGVYG